MIVWLLLFVVECNISNIFTSGPIGLVSESRMPLIQIWFVTSHQMVAMIQLRNVFREPYF